MTQTDRLFRALSWIVALGCVVFLMLPILITVAASFSASPVYTLPPPEWSLRWYASLNTRSGLWDAVLLSLNLAFVSTLISLVLGTLASIAVTRGNFRGREAIATFAVSPLMMPGLVVGVALLQFFREIGLRDAYVSLLLGHIVITLPFVMRTLLASMAAFDFSMIDAALIAEYGSSNVPYTARKSSGSERSERCDDSALSTRKKPDPISNGLARSAKI